jgi:hypothetical protein
MLRFARFATVVTGLGLLLHGAAKADDPTAAELLSLCKEGRGTQGHLLCAAYVSGVQQGIWAAQQFFKDGGKTCLPFSDVSDDQAIAIVMKYMKLRPDMLNKPMLAFTTSAFLAEYKCK